MVTEKRFYSRFTRFQDCVYSKFEIQELCLKIAFPKFHLLNTRCYKNPVKGSVSEVCLKNKINIEFTNYNTPGYQVPILYFKDTVLNQALPSLHLESLRYTNNPLNSCNTFSWTVWWEVSFHPRSSPRVYPLHWYRPSPRVHGSHQACSEMYPS